MSVVAPEKLLDQPLYDLAEAARLLDVPDGTLRFWLHGKQYKGSTYLPVLREARNRDVVVTWGEFIEAAVLRQLRRDERIPMRALRLFMFEVAQKFPGLRYPLASERVYRNGGALAIETLGGIWEPATGTNFDAASVEADLLNRIEWTKQVASAYRPSSEQPLVRIEPIRKHGAPTVEGVRTAAIFELREAGEEVAQLADEFRLGPDVVEEALRFERRLRGLTPVAAA
ncbi:MAG: hypothetical protein JJT89_13505 [Nitriliruptoraceae bacterium]|nr:hypothetical protein [Nitriliruptoraceae bacterium]